MSICNRVSVVLSENADKYWEQMKSGRLWLLLRDLILFLRDSYRMFCNVQTWNLVEGFLFGNGSVVENHIVFISLAKISEKCKIGIDLHPSIILFKCSKTYPINVIFLLNKSILKTTIHSVKWKIDASLLRTMMPSQQDKDIRPFA